MAGFVRGVHDYILRPLAIFLHSFIIVDILCPLGPNRWCAWQIWHSMVPTQRQPVQRLQRAPFLLIGSPVQSLQLAPLLLIGSVALGDELSGVVDVVVGGHLL